MFKMIFKRALIISLPVLSMSAQSGTPSLEFLASRCDELSRVITSLIDSQKNMQCIVKLQTASEQMGNTAILIRTNSPNEARYILNDAVASLQYAELLTCNQYIQIAHSKFEAYKIRKLL